MNKKQKILQEVDSIMELADSKENLHYDIDLWDSIEKRLNDVVNIEKNTGKANIFKYTLFIALIFVNLLTAIVFFSRGSDSTEQYRSDLIISLTNEIFPEKTFNLIE